MAHTIEGEYFLQGVREMASGFLLRPDHTFQFFFTYGALDRFANGEWEQEGNIIRFNSRPWPGSDFVLVKSEPGEKDHVTIEFEQNNQLLSAYMYASLANGADNTWERFDQRGYVHFPLRTFNTISLLFEFCPERFSVLPVNADGGHTFIIRPEPTLFEAFLVDFKLTLTGDGLKGRHPVMEGDEFVYSQQ